MVKTKNIAYGDLAWTEHIISSPDDYAEDTNFYCKLIKEHSKIESKTLLHLGCGAGINDYTFKKHFHVTGVDISKQMIALAKNLNPEVTYLIGDMRSIKLNNYYDAVTIPDSIGYMTTQEDLLSTLHTACNHLKPGGVLLIVAHTREEFKENNFVYTDSKGDIDITIFENNYITDAAATMYEATIVYLIRKKGKLTIYNDCHKIGLFKSETWHTLFKEVGIDIKRMELKNSYDRYIAGDGEYLQSIFIGTKAQ